MSDSSAAANAANMLNRAYLNGTQPHAHIPAAGQPAEQQGTVPTDPDMMVEDEDFGLEALFANQPPLVQVAGQVAGQVADQLAELKVFDHHIRIGGNCSLLLGRLSGSRNRCMWLSTIQIRSVQHISLSTV